MTITALLFASIRDAAGASRLELELPEGATVRQAADAVATRCGGLDLRGALCAVDEEWVRPERTLSHGETLALLPPVSGG